jgi:two-component system chemotaxis response regulator CheY
MVVANCGNAGTPAPLLKEGAMKNAIILVVDNSREIQSNLVRVLRRTGLSIKFILRACDGQDALGVMRQTNINIGLVICDINMRGMDGLQFLAAVKDNTLWGSIPVFMLTVEGGEARVEQALKLGAAGYIRKTCTANQVKEKLAGLIEPEH